LLLTMLNCCDAPMYRWALLVGCVLYNGIVWAQTGCFNYNYLFYPTQASNLTVGHARECQSKCRQSAGCEHFTYWKRNGMCLLAAEGANLLRTSLEGSVAGPKVCKLPSDPVCEQFAPEGFPAPTAMLSRRAWSGEQQPTNLQCWPRRPDGFPEPCPYQQVTVLEDTIDKWPGRCENMKKVTDLGPQETCQMRCYNSALCGVWKVENITYGVPTCWQALYGTNCYKGNVPPPMQAQRIMHGNVRLLLDTKGKWIKNLTKAFDATDVGNIEELGEEKCRSICSSYLFCQYWQYSTKLGCWVEDPAIKEVAYPMVMNSWAMETDTALAKSVKAGQYIQHICNVGSRIPFPTESSDMTSPARMTPLGVESTTSIHGNGKGTLGSQSPSQPRVIGGIPQASGELTTSIRYRDPGGSEKGTLGTQPPSQQGGGQQYPLFVRVLIVTGVAFCLAVMAGGAYTAMGGDKKRAKRFAGGSKKAGGSEKAGSSRQAQCVEHSFRSPSVGNIKSYNEPVALQQGESIPFLQNQDSPRYHGQPQQQLQCGNYGNSFPQPQQGCMPMQQTYQPSHEYGYQGLM